ncbi:cytochrome P450 [Microbacterium sp. STN6]|uniref:cytochrome P450 n=1 Tax=Microbacterium sp. STN6 TaxID=2995588 RepID=UPI002260D607|nr:cytochrome P450 [Microbacterium sp. STN6]MCX7521413.1 cytochrome P450 [Microbacterium sp. STN6]
MSLTLDSIPTLPGIDSTLAFLKDGYLFASKRCARLGSDAFHTRLGGRPVTFMLGADASRTFWSGGRFDRHGSIPPTATHLLQDNGSSQTLDGEEHRHRKRMFLEMMEPPERDRLRAVFAAEWDDAAGRWQEQGEIVLHDELQSVLTRTAMLWAGLDLRENDAASRAFELGEMVENAGRFGPRNWMARTLRFRTEWWARGVIDGVREGSLDVPEGSAVHRLATQTNLDGTLLDRAVAGVELLNTVRPIVAISRFIVFAALCLNEVPRWRETFAAGDDSDLAHFVTEVRRHAPFFRVMGGRVRRAFEWRQHPFSIGQWVLLDLYGTNHDPRLWPEPYRFRPERFRDWPGDPYTLIPQGGGEYLHDHRCAGEPVTIELMREGVRALSRSIEYGVPPQDLRVSLRHFPAGPASGFRINRVRRSRATWTV